MLPITPKLAVATFALALAASCAAAVDAPAESADTSAASARPSKIAADARVRHPLVIRSPRRGLRHVSVIRVEPAKPSFGQLIGLHQAADSLELKSGVALVLDQDTDEVLFSKNSQAVLPIASITKLMTAMVVTGAQQPLDEPITITNEDIDTEKGSRSRLKIGTTLRREEMLHLALMASENRAANALGRNYPGGLAAFVAAMNQEAHDLGMNDTRYVEPTGLSSSNQSSARDLATLVKAAHEVPLHPRAFDLARVHGRGRQPADAVPHHERSGEEPRVGDRPAEDRLHHGGGPLPGDAGQARWPPPDHGVPRFGRQVFAHRRRRARPPLDHGVGAGGPSGCARAAAQAGALRRSWPARREARQARCPRLAEICAAVARSRSSQDSSRRSAGAEIDRPATSLP